MTFLVPGRMAVKGVAACRIHSLTYLVVFGADEDSRGVSWNARCDMTAEQDDCVRPNAEVEEGDNAGIGQTYCWGYCNLPSSRAVEAHHRRLTSGRRLLQASYLTSGLMMPHAMAAVGC